MTTTDHPELLDALAVMLRLIEDRSSFERNAEKHSEKLGELLQRVENLKAELPEDAPEMLRHFLREEELYQGPRILDEPDDPRGTGRLEAGLLSSQLLAKTKKRP